MTENKTELFPETFWINYTSNGVAVAANYNMDDTSVLYTRYTVTPSDKAAALDDKLNELAFECETLVFNAMTRRAAPAGFMKLATDAVRAYFTTTSNIRAALQDNSELVEALEKAFEDEAFLLAARRTPLSLAWNKHKSKVQG